MKFKSIFQKILTILLVISIITTAWATLADVENKTASFVEHKEYVIFYGSVTFSVTDSTNNLYTQAMYIGDCDFQTTRGALHIWYPAFSGAPATARDVHVFLEGYIYPSATKRDATYFKSTSGTVDPQLDLDLAADTGAALFDTVGVVSGALDIALTSEWMRLRFDGQAGNPGAQGGNTYYWSLKVPKTVDGGTWGKSKYRGDRTLDTN